MLLGTLAALFPQTAISPLEPYLEQSLTPERSTTAAIALLRAGAAFLWLVALAWPTLAAATARLVARLSALSARGFWLLVVVAVAVPRALTAATFSFHPISDAGWYHETALSLTRGEGFRFDGELTAYRFPGYPFLLSLTYRLLGEHPGLAWVWGLLSTALILWLTHHLSRRLYGETPARLAVLGLALYPATVLRTGVAMSDLPFAAGLTVLMAVLVRGDSHRAGWAMAIGALLAALTLTRGPAAGLVVVVPVLWLLAGRPPSKVLAGSLLIATALAAGLAPWVLRNRTVFGRPVLSTNAGWNLYLGNYDGASGGFPAIARQSPRLPIGLDAASHDLALWSSTVDYIREHPFRVLALVPRKLFHFYALETNAVSLAFQGNQHLPGGLKFGLYGLSQLSYLLILALVLRRAGELFRADRRPRKEQWLGWSMIAYFTLVSLVFFGHDRFRLAILPVLMLEAAHVLSRAGEAVVRPAPPRPSRGSAG